MEGGTLGFASRDQSRRRGSRSSRGSLGHHADSFADHAKTETRILCAVASLAAASWGDDWWGGGVSIRSVLVMEKRQRLWKAASQAEGGSSLRFVKRVSKARRKAVRGAARGGGGVEVERARR